MFSLGFSEIFLIAIVAVLVIGPKDLPVVMAHIGRFVKRLSYVRYAAEQQMNGFLNASGLNDIKDQVNFESDAQLPHSSQASPADAHQKAMKEAKAEAKPKKKAATKAKSKTATKKTAPKTAKATAKTKTTKTATKGNKS